MRIAVIITTYNRPDALAAVLEGYLAQYDRRFEIVVADDGSTDETRQAIESYRKRAVIPLKHVWHEDHGFRAAAVRNRALAATSADYVILSDGDCVPLPGFVAWHRRLAEPGWFLSGGRVLLSESCTRRVLEQRIPLHADTLAGFIGARLKGEINRLLPMLPLPVPGFWRKRSPRRWQGAKTCNLSAWRDDLLAINGFDESYAGWGLEDSDLVLRLIHAGLHHKNARFGMPVLHLWHRENSREHLSENQRLLDELVRSRRTTAIAGVRPCRPTTDQSPVTHEHGQRTTNNGALR